MFELSPTPAIASLFSPIVVPSAPLSGDFAQALAQLVAQQGEGLPGIALVDVKPLARPLPAERQAIAADGNDLPNASAGPTLASSTTVGTPAPTAPGPPFFADNASPPLLRSLASVLQPARPLVTIASPVRVEPEDGVPAPVDADRRLPAPGALGTPKAARFASRPVDLPLAQLSVEVAPAAIALVRAARDGADTADTLEDQPVAARPTARPVVTGSTAPAARRQPFAVSFSADVDAPPGASASPILAKPEDERLSPSDIDRRSPTVRALATPKTAPLTSRPSHLPLEELPAEAEPAVRFPARASRGAADNAADTPEDQAVTAPPLLFTAPVQTAVPDALAPESTPDRASPIFAAARGSVPAQRPVSVAPLNDARDPVPPLVSGQAVQTPLPVIAAPSLAPDPKLSALATAQSDPVVRSLLAATQANAAPEPAPPFPQSGPSDPALALAGLLPASKSAQISAQILPKVVQRASTLASAGALLPVQPVPLQGISSPSVTPLQEHLPPPLIGLVVPAAHAFAAGIAAASFRPARALRDEDGLVSPGVSVPTALFQPAQTVAADGQQLPHDQQLALDMRREDWTRALIERVDASQDVANARDTRIRLVPDSLGKIDIALRQQGDTLHVHFTADQPATRLLLAEAQPSLAALADARGLRLGEASVDGTTSTIGQGQSQSQALGQALGQGFGHGADQRRAQQTPVAPPRTNFTRAADEPAGADHRIA